MKSERRRSNLNVKTFLHTPAIPVCSVKTTFYSNGCEELGRKPEIMKYSWSKTSKTLNCPSANVPWRQTHQLEICTSSFARKTVGTPMGQKPSMAPRPQPVPWASSLLCDRVCVQKQKLWAHQVQRCLNAQDTKYDTDRRRWGPPPRWRALLPALEDLHFRSIRRWHPRHQHPTSLGGTYSSKIPLSGFPAHQCRRRATEVRKGRNECIPLWERTRCKHPQRKFKKKKKTENFRHI